MAKTHLDLGFTALAAEVAAQYVNDFFPRALATAAALRDRGGAERLVWTTGSWILHHALQAGTDLQRSAVAAGVDRGDLAWHALPVTTHTELMDPALVRSGLDIAGSLDARFGRTTTAAKMTDVPGHTRGLVPLLAEAGVTFLHLGVNPVWPVPDVPPVFRWRSPDGAEVTVAYQAGGYGGEVAVPGCDEVLAFLHSGDNLGPPSVDDVVAAHAALAERHPGAAVQASTLDGFARALQASGAAAGLPAVTAEIGDPWIFGAASDPQKVAAYREVLRARARLVGQDSPADATTADRLLLLTAEHTWGLDQKVALPEDRTWALDDLDALRSTPAARRFEQSWAEQRAYVARAAEALALPPPADHPGSDPTRSGRWELAVDPTTGALHHLVDTESGRVLADGDHPLGLVTYQSFDEADYERFYAGLRPSPEDEWWARWDNTKPGIDADGAVSGLWHPEVTDVWQRDGDDRSSGELVVRLAFVGEPVDRLGAPPEVWCAWRFSTADGGNAEGDAGDVECRVRWPRKRANRLPEALWCSFVPPVAEPERWVMDKLGQQVSPLDVVRRGGRSLHAVGPGGVSYDGPDGAVRLASLDAPLVAPGRPNLLDADPPLPDMAGGWHVLLADNCWGTNFPMWIEGPMAYRFTITITAPFVPS